MEDDENFYIVTEYLGQNITLHSFSDDIDRVRRLTEDQVKTIIRNLQQGLIELHQQGIVHRDIKPDNIMINPATLEIKYIDFGLSCMMASCYDNRSNVGTFYYMAPETLIPEGDKADQSAIFCRPH